MTDATFLKLVTFVKWCSTSDFPQDIIVLLCSSPVVILPPQPCNLMKSDGLGPDFTLGLVHITLWRLNKTLNKGNKSWCPNTTPFHLPKVSFGLHPFNLEITLLFIYFMVGDGNFTLPHFDLSWPTLPHRFSLPCRGGRGIKRDFSFTYGGARNDLGCPTL